MSASVFRRRVARSLLAFLLAVVAAIALANARILTRHRDRLYASVDQIPARRVAVVLGANPVTAAGNPNLHFVSRMDATAALFHAGKVRHVLVSGDNHHRDYDEPTAMKQALVARDVPPEAITCDYAGFRTHDSITRAQIVFGLQQCTIVTQSYHNPRALEIARAHGLDTIGFCAADVPFRHSLRTELREVIARTTTMIDLYVLHRQPRFIGRFEPILVAQN